MTDTADAPEATAPEQAPRAPRWELLVGLAAVAVVLAVGVAAFAVTRDNDDRQQAATTQIAAARQACQQWLGDDDTQGARPPADWCDDMASWMTDNTTKGRMTTGGTRMWDGPQAMRDVCTRAAGNGSSADDDPAQWCDQMVGWMSEHMGDWHDSWGN